MRWTRAPAPRCCCAAARPASHELAGECLAQRVAAAAHWLWGLRLQILKTNTLAFSG